MAAKIWAVPSRGECEEKFEWAKNIKICFFFASILPVCLFLEARRNLIQFQFVS